MALFDPAAATFFTELGRNNSRDWFTAHRDDYDRLVRAPLEQLAADAEPVYGRAHVTRPNRDVRFSNDKSPYKTDASMWAGEVGGVYIQLSARGISAGGGLYEPSRDQLARAREAIDQQPAATAALSESVTHLQSAGFELAGPGLRTAPRGYPKEHPSIELLRLKHYAALTRLPIDATYDDVREAWRAAKPLVDWAARWVGPAEAWP